MGPSRTGRTQFTELNRVTPSMSQIVYSDWPLLPTGLSYRNPTFSDLDSQVKHRFPSIVHSLKKSLYLFLASWDTQTASAEQSFPSISALILLHILLLLYRFAQLLNFLLADPMLFRIAKSTQSRFTSIFLLIQMPFTQTELQTPSNAFTFSRAESFTLYMIQPQVWKAISHQRAVVHVETVFS